MIIHQSDIQSLSRCPEQYRLSRAGFPRRQLSATAYGSVMHHALHAGARMGNDVKVALETFEYYWHPLHIEQICEPVDTWLPRDSYASLRAHGIESIKKFFDLIRDDDAELLALEFEFMVPMDGVVDPEDGSTVVLAGTVDRLAADRYRRKPILRFDDLKTGKRKTYLRHNVQGTAYAYASTQPEFWMGWPEMHTDGFGDEGQEMYLRYAGAARKFNWIDLKDMAFVNGGWRGPKDYERLKYAAQQLVNSIRLNVFPLSLDGEVCTFCDFRDHCAGIGIDDKSGDPFA